MVEETSSPLRPFLKPCRVAKGFKAVANYALKGSWDFQEIGWVLQIRDGEVSAEILL